MPRLFARSSRASIASLGEERLIVSIRRWLGAASPPAPFGIGDDCAVLPASGNARLITVDPIIHGVHFDDRTSPRAAGAKLLKRNLSDIAAMGGRPRAAVVSLALDGRVSRAWLKSFHGGLAAESRRHRFPIVGGDVARLPGRFVATLTLIGDASGRILTRRGARIGDRIYVTGALGRSFATGHHHRFQPRLAEGAWLARRREVRSLMDVSDGLAKDLPALAPKGSEAVIDPGLLPRRDGATDREALGDGEDYELVFAVAGRSRAGVLEKAWRRAFPSVRLTCIGRFARAGTKSRGVIRPEPSVATSIFDRLLAGLVTGTGAETQAVAAEFASILPPDATLALHGDLGAGKTTFVQGLARGFGITESVTSPTFTICTLHRGGSRLLAHLDAYRLTRPGLIDELLLDEFLISPWCLAIEWPENTGAWLPRNAWHLDLAIVSGERHQLSLRRPAG